MDPDKNLHVDVRQDNSAPEGDFVYDANVAARIDAFARASEWRYGVQAISISTSAVADVELDMRCQMGMTVDPSVFPPDVILRPRVLDARVRTTSFRPRGISKASGPIGRKLAKSLEEYLTDKLANRTEKLVAKMNRHVDKHQDRFRFSASEALPFAWPTGNQMKTPLTSKGS